MRRGDARTRRPRLLLWLAFGLLAAVTGVIIATFASSEWAPHVVQQVPATHIFAGTAQQCHTIMLPESRMVSEAMVRGSCGSAW